MKEYNGKSLYVGNLVVYSSEFKFLDTYNLKISDQKYIFQKISEDEYKEVFSGMTTIIWPELSCQRRIPYLINIESIIDYIPEFEFMDNIDNVELLVALDKINSMTKGDKKKIKNR